MSCKVELYYVIQYLNNNDVWCYYTSRYEEYEAINIYKRARETYPKEKYRIITRKIITDDIEVEL